ncbi:hypothetical protein L5515_009885 [Caenorhabditis briggsae]|uniref:Uncharacterized protein n=1 Tax=Caenorhabditis briggsae TaxID=6238 RepID=A0AAE9D374_CAEBR|nr:hypothetical protein L3Y34_010086 [Caenorhabditis briggsae]UMM38491.1 hypothetical protein L5515_009885 [Caenorhabditis briggsae]
MRFFTLFIGAFIVYTLFAYPGIKSNRYDDYDDREGVAIDFVLETVNVTEDENGKIVFRHRRYIISGLHYA